MFVSEIKVSKVELAQDIYELADPAKLVQSFVCTSEVAKEQKTISALNNTGVCL